MKEKTIKLLNKMRGMTSLFGLIVIMSVTFSQNEDMAIGYLNKGEVQMSVTNYDPIVSWDHFPAGLWNGNTYLPQLSFMVGIPGKNINGDIYPWALRPHPQNTDTLVYWGPTVSESFFSRAIPPSNLTDWAPIENANGFNFSGEVFADSIYTYNYVEEGVLALANSDFPSTWPLNNNMEPFWPGWDDENGDINSQFVYLELDDRLATRDVDTTQGYPTEIIIKMMASASNSSYFDDAIVYQLKLINQSVYDYKELFFGIYYEVDNASTDENGSFNVHTNADDMFGINDSLNLVYIYDYDGQSNSLYNPAYVGLMFMDTPQNTGLSGFRWFDWYSRPGVYSREGNFNCCAGDGYRPVAEDKEAIQYALLSNQIEYPYRPLLDWGWRGVNSGANPRENDYKEWFFHSNNPSTDLDSDIDPNFDSIEGILETSFFAEGEDGMDCLAFLSSGPYELDAGTALEISFTLVFGEDENDLISKVQNILNTITNPIIGDVNQDGEINILDIVISSNLAISGEFNEIADLNGDGEINILDLVMLVDLVLN